MNNKEEFIRRGAMFHLVLTIVDVCGGQYTFNTPYVLRAFNDNSDNVMLELQDGTVISAFDADINKMNVAIANFKATSPMAELVEAELELQLQQTNH